MRSWVKAYGGLTVAAGIAYFIAIIMAIVLGDLPDGYTLYDVVLDDYFMVIAIAAGALLALAGVTAIADGFKNSRAGITMYGFAALLAAVYIMSMHFIADETDAINTEDIVLYLNLIFVAFGILALAKDSLNGFFVGTIIIAVLTLLVDICYVMYYNDMNTFITGLVIGVLIVAVGVLCFPSDSKYCKIEAAAAAKVQAAEQKAAEDAAAKEEKFAAIKAENEAKYKEYQAAKAAEQEAAAKKAEEEKKAAEEKAAAEKAAAEKAAAQKAEEEKKAAEEAAAQQAAAEQEAAAKKAEEEKQAAEAAAAENAAAEKAEAEKKAAEEAAAQKAAAEQEAAAKKAEEEKQAAEQKAAEEAAAQKAAAEKAEEEKKAAEAAAAAAAVAAASAAAAAESAKDEAFEKVCKACYDRDLVFGRDYGEDDIPMAYPAEKLAVYVFSGSPENPTDSKLEAAGWTIIKFDGSEVTDGKKEAEVVIDYLAELQAGAPVEEEAAPFEPAEPETIVLGPDFSNLDLGIEPETVETPVRRTAYNMGLRFRRKYGPYKIPVAFVSCKVAVYVTDGVPEDENDAALKEDGWTILRFDGAEVTDGKKEADIIAETVKEATRAQKAAAAKAKRAKARKAKKN